VFVTPMTVSSIDVKSVLFATDFSPVSDPLLRYAATIARIHGAQFFVAHVAAPDVYNIGCAGAVRSAVETARRDSEQLEQELLQNGALAGLRYEFIVREGDTWEELEQIIREKRVGLLVIGARSKETAGRHLGTTARQLFCHADCPVLTVSGGRDLDSPADRDQKIRSLLFATDFGMASHHALAHAVSLANRTGASLTLVHALPTIPAAEAIRLSVQAKDMTQIQEDARLACFQRLEELVSKQTALVVRPDFSVTFGIASEQILRVAELRKANVILMGLSRSARVETASGLSWATAHEVVCGADCPVLTIRC